MDGSLSPEDAALVLRRAVELDTPTLADHDRLDESVVREAAREVGLSDAAVSQAVHEFRSGALVPLPALPPGRRVGLPAVVVVERSFGVPPEHARAALSAWLRTQWFECRRATAQESRWRPRSGPIATARRTLDLRHTLRLDGVRELAACVTVAADGSRVRLVADLAAPGPGLLAGIVGAPAVVTGTITFGFLAGLGHPLPELLAAVPVAAAAGGTGWLGARSVLQRRCDRIRDELDLALDAVGAPRRPGARVPDWSTAALSGKWVR